MTLEFSLIADDLVSFPLPHGQHRTLLADRLRQSPDVLEAVEGMETITLQFDPLSVSPDELFTRIENLSHLRGTSQKQLFDTITLQVEYSEQTGPDLKNVCQSLGLSVEEFIKIHTSQIYTVDLIGFTPGFAYLGDAPFNLPRLKEPRLRVQSGSVGLAGGYTGLYSLDGPGGWPIVGRITKKLFEPANSNPFTLSPQMKVKFEAIDQ